MYSKSRAQGFGAEVKRRILIGTYVLSHGYYDAYYLQAQRIRRLIANDFAEAFRQCDVILGPTSPSTAFRLGEKAADPGADVPLGHLHHRRQPGRPARDFDPLRLCRRPAGRPAADRQLFHRGRLLNVAHRYQQVTDWHLQRPAGDA
jgi:aspartyl-tRNA(Asn)/glutamyl-tRNA(Gln) amidotransferase subunit A